MLKLRASSSLHFQPRAPDVLTLALQSRRARMLAATIARGTRVTEDFRRLLIEWYQRMRRDLPWRRTRDPYAIWLSEIMLQQTRVAAVIGYYERFLKRFPTIEALAAANDDELLVAWSGLGYYSRVRNMHRAAQMMSGIFPADYEQIRALPGIGDYTAAAVASIAFGLPYAAIDGNVMRVLTRVTNDSSDIGVATTKDRIRAVAARLLDAESAGEFNQAMMELGATVCLPRDPQCVVCPFEQLCEARRAGTQAQLPAKRTRSEIVRVSRTLYIVEKNKSLLFWQRTSDAAMLAGFWELPEAGHLINPPKGTTVGHFHHSITNHDYSFEVRTAESVRCREGLACSWLSSAALSVSPVSTTAKKALQLYRLAR